MARTRQTARKSTGGKAPRKQVAVAYSRGKGGKGLGKGGYSQPMMVYNYAPAAEAIPSNSNNNSNNNPINYSITWQGGAANLPDQIQTLDADEQVETVLKTIEDVLDVDLESLTETSFYAHYFQVGQERQKIFHPKFSLARTQHPISKEDEFWMSLNFNSKLDGEGIKRNGRPDLNLVVALDISGSMANTFEGEQTKGNSKIKVAKDCLLIILSQLQPEDSFGLVLFNEKATVVHPLTKWKDTERVGLEKSITRFRPGGGTELSEGLHCAKKMYEKFGESLNSSNRIFLLTDLEATSNADSQAFLENVKKFSEENFWTTVIGIGMDLSVNIIETVSKTPGANYSNVRSTDNFKDLMDKEFGYLVSPIAFNINVELQSNSLQIAKGFGGPEVNRLQPGQPVVISTEFPSVQNETGEKRPGPLLFKISKKPPTQPENSENNSNNSNNATVENSADDSKLVLRVTHEDLQGVSHKEENSLEFDLSKYYYQDDGIRKAILLVHYSELVREYMEYSRMKQIDEEMPFIDYHFQFVQFKEYFEREKGYFRDNSLQLELDVINNAIVVASQQSNLPNDVNTKRKVDEISPAPAEIPFKRSAGPVMSVPPPSASSPAPAPSVLSSSSNNDPEDLPEDQTCVICLTNRRSVLLMPCRHLCTCTDCSGKTSDCPLCRAQIQSRTTVFL